MKKSIYTSIIVFLILLNITTVSSQEDTTKVKTPNFEDLYVKGQKAYNDGNYSKSIEYLQQAEIINPDSYNLTTMLGIACKELNLYASAITYMGNAINIDKTSQSLGNLAAVYADLGRYDAALEFLNQSLDINPNYQHSLCNKGSVLTQQGRFEEALGFLSKAISSESALPQSFANIGEVYLKMGEPENALIYLSKALEKDSTLSETAIFKVEELKNLNKKPSEYNPLCKQVVFNESDVLSKNPENYNSLIFRASAYKFLNKKKLMRSDLNNALSILNKLIPLYPQGSNLIKSRAEVYAMLGNINLAIEDYRKVLELNPGNPSAKDYLQKNE